MKKRILSSLLAACMIGSQLYVTALAEEPIPATETAAAPGADLTRTIRTSGTTGEVRWSFDVATATITFSGKGKMGDGFGEEDLLWHYQNITDDVTFSTIVKKAIIEDGVTNIGRETFTRCRNLESVSIPQSVTSIEQEAFVDCSSLKNITLPDGLTSMGQLTFSGCSGLTNIKIPEKVNDIGPSSFEGCTNLSQINIPDGVTRLDGTFEGCAKLNNVVIPGKVNYIGDDTFNGCRSLTSINIPSKVGFVGSDAFKDCTSLKTVYYAVDRDLLKRGSMLDGNDIFFNEATWIYSATGQPGTGEAATDKCGENLKYTLKTDSGELFIYGSGATYNFTDANPAPWSQYASKITTIKLEAGVSGIGTNTFKNCTNIKTIYYNRNKQTILNATSAEGNSTFINANWIDESLDTLTVQFDLNYDGATGTPDDITVEFADYISAPAAPVRPNYVFRGWYTEKECYNAWDFEVAPVDDNMTLYAKWSKVGSDNISWTFDKNTGVLTISGTGEMEDYLTHNGTVRVPWWEHLQKIGTIIIQPGITRIGNEAFDGVYKVTHVTIPNTVKRIGEAAFAGVPLESITIPDSVVSIGQNAFNYGQFSEVTIPDSVVDLQPFAFQNCENLSSVKFPAGIKSIPDGLFGGCTSLKEITIPQSVTSIGPVAFRESGLTSITLYDNITSIAGGAFNYCDDLTTVYYYGDEQSIRDATDNIRNTNDAFLNAKWIKKGESSGGGSEPGSVLDVLNDTQATPKDILNQLKEFPENELNEALVKQDAFNKLHEVENKTGTTTVTVENGLEIKKENVSVAGAKLNRPEDDNVTLKFGQPENKNLSIPVSNRTEKFRFSARLFDGSNQEIKDGLDIPAVIQIPLPARAKEGTLQVWHHHNGKTEEVENVAVDVKNDKSYVTFPMDSFSDVVLTYRRAGSVSALLETNRKSVMITDTDNKLVDGALVFAASYDQNGRMLATVAGSVKVSPYGTSVSFEQPLEETKDAAWELFFLHPKTFAPLCENIPLT